MKLLKNLKTLALLLGLILTSFQTLALEQIHIDISTIRVAGKTYFDDDVKKHFEATRLNEELESKLFLMAGKDWDKYQQIKDATFKKQFKTLVKEFTYLKVLQYDATKRKRYGSSKKESPKFFQVKQDYYFKLVQDNETKRLKEYLDKRMGIVKGRVAFAEEVLKKNGYPHKADESSEDIYWRWYYAERRRIKAEIYVSHAKQYEFHRSLEVIHSLPRRSSFGRQDDPLRGIYIRPTDLHSFFKDAEEKVSSLLSNKEMSSAEVNKVLKENPEISAILKKIEVLTPKDFPIAKYVGQTDKFQQVKTDLSEGLGPKLNQQLTSRIMLYIDKAYSRTQKFSKAQLEQLVKQSLAKFAFSNQGDYSQLMAAYIYDLALSLKESNSSEFIQLKSDLSKKLNDSYASLIQAMKEDSFFLAKDNKNDKFLFETLVSQYIGNDLLSSYNGEDSTDIQIKAVNLASWVAEFEAKKVTRNYTSTVVVDVHAYNTFEGQEAATKYLRSKEFDRGRDKFRDDLRNYYNGFLHLNIHNGQEVFSGRSAIDFIIEE